MQNSMISKKRLKYFTCNLEAQIIFWGSEHLESIFIAQSEVVLLLKLEAYIGALCLVFCVALQKEILQGSGD